tara:strand:- start:65 stop:343 length:279 start_codon:yes stop_codon:yes gene_type:complete
VWFGLWKERAVACCLLLCCAVWVCLGRFPLLVAKQLPTLLPISHKTCLHFALHFVVFFPVSNQPAKAFNVESQTRAGDEHSREWMLIELWRR